MNPTSSKPIIGYCLSDEKQKSLKFHEFLSMCRNANIKTIEINEEYLLHTHFKEHERINIIIHKLTSTLAREITEDDANAGEFLTKLEQMIREQNQRPLPLIVVDDFEATKRLLNRDIQYSLLSEINDIYTPPFVIVKDEATYKNTEALQKLLDEKSILYPIICKPIRAHGSGSHNMKIIFDNDHIHEIPFPCIIQKFINHDAILVKAYLLGEINDDNNGNFNIVYRNSLKNFPEIGSKETLSFTTKEVCRSAPSNLNSNQFQQNSIDESKIRHICKHVQKKFQLYLMGIDIIIDCETKNYAVIDVNYFPGYDSLRDVNKRLLDICLKLYEHQLAKNEQPEEQNYISDKNEGIS